MTRMLRAHEILHEIDDRSPRVGPLDAAERHMDERVTKECVQCGQRKLKRYLVEGRWGPHCRLGCHLQPDPRLEADLSAALELEQQARPPLWQQVHARAQVMPPPPRETRADVTVVNTCRCCGRADTRASWQQLEQISARQVREDDGTLLFEEMRNCRCGSTRMVTTKSDGRTFYREGES